MTTYSAVLKYAEKEFIKSGIKSGHIDSLILLENTINKTRSFILAHPENKINRIDKIKYLGKVNKRKLHKPIAQIIGCKEFYGRNFLINKNVLIPRPETEEIIVQFNKLLENRLINAKSKVCDLGTGCGAIGITLKLEHPELTVDLIDLYSKTLSLARKNVVNYSTQQKLILSNLLKNAPSDYDVIVANLPYVPLDININKEAKYEPKEAIYAKDDGISLYADMFNQIDKLYNKPLYLIIEFLDISIDSINKIARDNNYILQNRTGLVSTYSLKK